MIKFEVKNWPGGKSLFESKFEKAVIAKDGNKIVSGLAFVKPGADNNPQAWQWAETERKGNKKFWPELFDLFVKEIRPNSCYRKWLDNYYPYHILYRIDDLDDGAFYIGLTENLKTKGKYTGSGKLWVRHMKAHPDINKVPNDPEAHHYKMTILRDDFDVPADLREAEYNEIKKHVYEYDSERIIKAEPGLKNARLRTQNQHFLERKYCEICGCSITSHHHKKWCPHYIPVKICKECGGRGGRHRKGCSKWKDQGNCPECGYPIQSRKHAKTCSHYKEPKNFICEECGYKSGNHAKTCSKYKPRKIGECPECRQINGHKPSCSKYKDTTCKECGGKKGRHKKGCSMYKEKKVCPECGGKGLHRISCSKYKPDARSIKKIYCYGNKTLYWSARAVIACLFKVEGDTSTRAHALRSTICAGKTYHGYKFDYWDDIKDNFSSKEQKILLKDIKK